MCNYICKLEMVFVKHYAPNHIVAPILHTHTQNSRRKKMRRAVTETMTKKRGDLTHNRLRLAEKIVPRAEIEPTTLRMRRGGFDPESSLVE